jgi:molecular chaperone DnaK
MERLTQSSHKLAEAMYKQAAASGAGAGAGPRPSEPTDAGQSEAGVIDAEYVDVDKR